MHSNKSEIEKVLTADYFFSFVNKMQVGRVCGSLLLLLDDLGLTLIPREIFSRAVRSVWIRVSGTKI